MARDPRINVRIEAEDRATPAVRAATSSVDALSKAQTDFATRIDNAKASVDKMEKTLRDLKAAETAAATAAAAAGRGAAGVGTSAAGASVSVGILATALSRLRSILITTFIATPVLAAIAAIVGSIQAIGSRINSVTPSIGKVGAAFGRLFDAAATGIVTTVNLDAVFQSIARSLDAMAPAVQRATEALGKMITKLSEAAGPLVKFWSQVNDRINEGLKPSEALQRKLIKLGLSADDVAEAMGDLVPEVIKFNTTARDAKQETLDLTTGMEKLAKALGLVSSQQIAQQITDISFELERARIQTRGNTDEFVMLEAIANDKIRSLQARLLGLQEGLGDIGDTTRTVTSDVIAFSDAQSRATGTAQGLTRALSEQNQELFRGDFANQAAERRARLSGSSIGGPLISSKGPLITGGGPSGGTFTVSRRAVSRSDGGLEF